MNKPLSAKSCPNCGTGLPAADSIVCPSCNAILRPDPDIAETQLETNRRRNLLLMTVGAIVVFALTFRLSPRLPLVPLGLACVYVAAFKFSERRAKHPVRVIALSIVVWLGFCALLLGILFVGCLVVFSRR